MHAIARTEVSPPYHATADHGEAGEYKLSSADRAVIEHALDILRQSLRTPGAALDGPKAVRDYLALLIGRAEREEFWVLYLDAQHRVIESVCEFTGSLQQASVYPREIARSALRYNAAAVILSHNHPSGHVEPSRADEFVTQQLKAALATVDVRVLDHIVVGGASTASFAERGLL